MSIFSSIGKAVKGVFKAAKSVVLPAAGYAIGGPIGGAIGGVLAGTTQKGAPAVISGGGGGGPLVPLGKPSSGGWGPALGGLAVGGLAGGAAMRQMTALDAYGRPVRKRRRSRGITATELKNHRRVETFLQKNFKCKSGGTRGTHIRRRASR